ncbi:MAG: hypothetical protein ACXQTG_03370 [Methanoculleaceae archaeon]
MIEIMIGVGLIALMLIIHTLMATYAGWEAEIRIAANTGSLSGASGINWKDLSFEVQNNIKKIYSGGSRDTVDLKETIIDIATSLTRDYEDWSTIADRAGVGSTGALTEYAIGIYPEGYSSGKRKIEATIKFNSWKLSLKSGEVTEESTDIYIKGSPSVGTL